jgi:hypothetical protein
MRQGDFTMKKLILICTFFGAVSVFAQSKEDVRKALDQLEASKMFTKEQMEKARAEFNQMSDAQYQQLLQNAYHQARDPANLQKAQQMLDANPQLKKMQEEQLNQLKQTAN